MAFIEIIGERDASGTLKKIYDNAVSRAGGVANIIRVMSQHATSCHRSMQLYVNLMQEDNALPRSTREMLATVVSNANGCFY